MTSALAPEVFDAAIALVQQRARKRQYVEDPVLWAQEYLGIQLWSKQREILYTVRDNRKTAVAAGHGVGKSFVAAVLMAWWIDVHPLGADETGAPQTFVASTAPFSDQISAILWNNLRILHALSKARFDDGKVDHALPGYITGENKWKTNDGLIIGQGRKPPDNQTDSGYQGLHATYLLAIGDEAAGLGADMIDALGNITTGPHNRLLLIANPTDPSSAMAQIWKKKMDTWVRMHLSVFDSPRITGEEGFDVSKAPALSGQEYIDEKLDEWGEDDPRYQSRVLGQWAFDAGNNVFTDVDLARAAGAYVLPDPSGIVYIGCDVARMGLDASFIYARREGEVWATDPETGKPTKPTGQRGAQLRYVDSWSKTPLVTNDFDTPGTAEKIHQHALAIGAKFVMVDAAGLGQGVIDGLAIHNTGQYLVVEVYGSASSSDSRAYLNARAQVYFDMKKQMFANAFDLDPEDAHLFDELRIIVYEYTERGARKIESKDSMKKRGAKSPDRADALSYAALDITAITDNPLSGIEKGEKLQMDPWESAFEDEFGVLELPW